MSLNFNWYKTYKAKCKNAKNTLYICLKMTMRYCSKMYHDEISLNLQIARDHDMTLRQLLSYLLDRMIQAHGKKLPV